MSPGPLLRVNDLKVVFDEVSASAVAEGIADVDPDELRGAQPLTSSGIGQRRIDADHPIHVVRRGQPAGQARSEEPRDARDQHRAAVTLNRAPGGAPCRTVCRPGQEDLLAGFATRDARLAQQLAMLLLRHPLAALLDD